MENKKIRSWTTYEIRYIREHRSYGPAAIAEVLGRTEQAVRKQASRQGISWRVSSDALCPICGRYMVHNDTVAAKHGMCIPCWNKRVADIKREQEAEQRTERLREAARKAAQRATEPRRREKRR